jgi:hypothetical protein
MVQFLITNPLFVLLSMGMLVIISKFVVRFFGDNPNGSDNDEDDGGMNIEDPVLDLPPGVSLPVDEHEPATI